MLVVGSADAVGVTQLRYDEVISSRVVASTGTWIANGIEEFSLEVISCD